MGTYCYENGQVYQGRFKKQRKHGLGVLKDANGKKLKGFWFEDDLIFEC